MSDLYANWARVYDYFFPDRSPEVGFWKRLGQRYGHRLLDLMCGTAEVSLGLARGGNQVLGVDLSAAMLAAGAGRLAGSADYPARRLSLAQGDALAIPAPDGAFDFALVSGNGSFNHLDEGQAQKALRELRRVLRAGGGLGMELINPHLLKEIYPERTFCPFRPTPPGVWVEKRSANRYDRNAGLFHIQQVTQYNIDGERGEFETSFALHVHQPEEVRALLEAAGFADIEFYGGYDLQPFDEWSPDLVVIGRSAPQHVQPRMPPEASSLTPTVKENGQ
jgi:ubiquinone/menaquinone biosynthesis C-methylase UbiE